jgi:hypothetical protein
VSGANQEEKQEASLSSPKHIMHYVNTLEHAIIYFEVYGK